MRKQNDIYLLKLVHKREKSFFQHLITKISSHICEVILVIIQFTQRKYQCFERFLITKFSSFYTYILMK